MAIALGWIDWRLLFRPVNVEEEIIDLAIHTRQSLEEIWRWPTQIRQRYTERFIKHKDRERAAIEKARKKR